MREKEKKRGEKRREKRREKGEKERTCARSARSAQRAALPRHGGADRVLSLRAFKCAVCKWTYE